MERRILILVMEQSKCNVDDDATHSALCRGVNFAVVSVSAADREHSNWFGESHSHANGISCREDPTGNCWDPQTV
jgi:hypothetical protein